MKKALVITALVVSMGFLGWQQASANKGMGGGPGMGSWCQKGGPGYTQLDAASKAKLDKFYDETKDLRKQMVMKHAEEVALMNATNPDPAQAAKLAGELFDLRSTIQDKAEAAGVQGLIGCGDCQGMGPGMGRGAGHGMGPGMMNAGPNKMGAGAAKKPAGGGAQ